MAKGKENSTSTGMQLLRFRPLGPSRTRTSRHLERSIAALGLPLGTYDDAAHEVFMQAPVLMRERAERNAAMVRLLVSLGQRAGWPERLCLLQRQFGVDCPSKGTLKRHLKTVKGIDPINYAPALLPKAMKARAA